jgi:hypothetical protein
LKTYFFNFFLYLHVGGIKTTALAILKYSRVKNIYNTLITNRFKITAKDIVDFLNYLKSGEFNEILKAKESEIQAISILIHLKLIEKGTFIIR